MLEHKGGGGVAAWACDATSVRFRVWVRGKKMGKVHRAAKEGRGVKQDAADG